jgi:tetratricopeptide (TPR) repeat protein
VLRYMVENAGRLVTQSEILEAVWPETYVNAEVIKKYILELRKILGDRLDEPQFIQTIHKRGYRFIAPVTNESESASVTHAVNSAKIVVGRTEILTKLGGCLDRVLRGHRQVAFVAGEAGIGKTTLVDMFHQQAVNHTNLRIARGQCVEGFGGKEAYYPMLEALGQLVRHKDNNSFLQILSARAPTWLVQFPALLNSDMRTALLQETMGTTRERMLREICEFLEVLTEEHPLLLILEDLHWADPSTLDLISALARRREPCRLLVLATYRPTDVVLSQNPLKGMKQDLLVHQLCQEIVLDSLQEPAIAEYLALRFPTCNFPSGLPELILRHSGGSPLFMVTTVEEMVKDGLIIYENGRWALTRSLEDIDPGLPETLQQMMQCQFERLSVEEQQVLRCASVAGMRFSVWAISSAAQMGPERVEELCEALAERQQFIRSAGICEVADATVSACYEFRHSLYRQAVYRVLSDVSRARLHRLLGERLKPLCTPAQSQLAAQIALHFEEGGNFEAAVRYMILAAKSSARKFGYRDSIRVLQHALQLVDRIQANVGAELETQIFEVIGDAQFALGAMAESVRAYETAATRAAQANLHAVQVGALACLVRPLGLIDPRRGIEAIDRASQLATTLHDPLLVARTQMLAAAIRLLYDKWTKENAELCESAYETLGSLSDSVTASYDRMIYAHTQLLQGKYQAAFVLIESGESYLDDTSSLMAHFFAMSGKTVALLRLGRWGEVLQIVRAGRELAHKNGNDPWIFNFREAWLRTLALDFEGAQQFCETILSANTQYPTEQPKTIAKVAAGYAELNRKEYRQAAHYFRQVLDSGSTSKFFLHWYWRMIARLGLSKVWLGVGDVGKAGDEADQFLTSALSTADPHLQTLAWEAKMQVAVVQKDYSDAEAFLQKGLAIIADFEVPVAAWQLHATAWDFYRLHKRDDILAESHRRNAKVHLTTIINSFDPDEPLRKVFLAADSISRIVARRVPTAVLV